MVSELLIGARGWQHPQWVARFYPDDMPEDWRFSYYCNEFRAVLLPQAGLLAADPATVQDWHDDIGDEFLFFIELDALDNWQACLERLAPLQVLVGGFVLRPATCTVKVLEQCVPGLQQWAPVCLDEGVVQADAALLHFIRQHQVGCCWDARHAAPAWREGDLSIALLEGGFDIEARQLREILENCLRGMRGKPYKALFVTGASGTRDVSQADRESSAEAPSIETLQQAIQLRDLME